MFTTVLKTQEVELKDVINFRLPEASSDYEMKVKLKMKLIRYMQVITC